MHFGVMTFALQFTSRLVQFTAIHETRFRLLFGCCGLTIKFSPFILPIPRLLSRSPRHLWKCKCLHLNLSAPCPTDETGFGVDWNS